MYVCMYVCLKGPIFRDPIDLGLIDTVPPWYSPIKPQPVYETAEVQAYWDVPVYGEFQELRANRVDARIVNNQHKQVSAGDELPLGEQP